MAGGSTDASLWLCEMISVASPLALRRTRLLLGVVMLLFTVIQAATWQSADAPRLLAAGEHSATVANPAAADDQWRAYPFAVEHTGQSPPWWLPTVRLTLTFGDGTWHAAAADQREAAVATARRREIAATTRRLSPLGTSLQAQSIRLQI